jgi:hypothetical protein
MLESGPAIAEPDASRANFGDRRGLRARSAASLPQLLDTRHVRAELSRLRCAAGPAGIAALERATQMRVAAALDESRAG